MLIRLLLLFTVIPIIELMLLFRIGARIGPLPTVALVLVTGIVGAWLARLEGLRTLRKIHEQLSQGSMPGEALVHGAMILVAASLLVTPGMLTDAFGFFLLIPPVRHSFAPYLIRYFRSRVNVIQPGPEEPEIRRPVDARVTTVEKDPSD